MALYRIIKLRDEPKNFWEQMQRMSKEVKYIESKYSEASYNYMVMKNGENENIEDISMIMTSNEEPIWLFMGTRETNKEKSNQIVKFYDYDCTSIELEKMTRNEIKEIKKCVIKIVSEVNIEYKEKASGALTIMAQEIMKCENSKITIELNKILSLEKDLDGMWQDLRKSYKSLINWGIKNMQIFVWYGNNVDWRSFNEFRELHIRESGRETRNVNTWIEQWKAIKNKKAFCVIAVYKDRMVSAGYFGIGHNHCYYGVSASRRDMFDRPLFHALMWKAIKFAKEQAITYFELGESKINEEMKTTKEKNIEKFKAGFGGKVYTQIQIKNDYNEK